MGHAGARARIAREACVFSRLARLKWPNPYLLEKTGAGLADEYLIPHYGFQLGVDALILLVLPKEVTGSKSTSRVRGGLYEI
jgi:hypothetical protein